MIPDASVGQGSTHLLKSTPKHLSQLTTGQQGVPGTFSMNGDFLQSWAYLGHNLVMLFYQQESKSCTDNLKTVTCNLLYIQACKYHDSKGRRSTANKLARKRFFSPKTPTKIHQTQENFLFNPLIVVTNSSSKINFLSNPWCHKLFHSPLYLYL